ncbi:MAG: GNAT family N-acetyltransferase [Bacteroidales bacterium]
MKANQSGFQIRPVTKEELPVLLSLIKELAEYEKLSHMVETTVEGLEKHVLGEQGVARAVMGWVDGEAVGYAIWFYNFSTFVCKPGLYLEDVYVKEMCRGKGYGKAFLVYLAKLAKEKDCGRFEWVVLDWNEPSIRFYESLGATLMKEWIITRVDGPSLEELAAK